MLRRALADRRRKVALELDVHDSEGEDGLVEPGTDAVEEARASRGR